MVEAASELRIERKAVNARRMARSGEILEAIEVFNELMPQATQMLRPRRLLRFLSHYCAILSRQADLSQTELLRSVANHVEIACLRLETCPTPEAAESLRRYLDTALSPMLDLAQRLGEESGLSQAILQSSWSLLGTLDRLDHGGSSALEALASETSVPAAISAEPASSEPDSSEKSSVEAPGSENRAIARALLGRTLGSKTGRRSQTWSEIRFRCYQSPRSSRITILSRSPGSPVRIEQFSLN